MMTIVAWDGATMAADRMSCYGSTPLIGTRKIHRIESPDKRTFLVGCSGRRDHIEAFMAWLRGGSKPDMQRDDEFSTMVIDPRRRIWLITGTLIYVQISAKKWGVGCGVDYALGAMAAGATAQEAVRIASKLDINCGGGVDFLTH